MKFGVIIETRDPEKAWNGVRFANASLKAGHEARIFLMGAGVEIESVSLEPHNAKGQVDEFVGRGGKVMACGTCLVSRSQEGSRACPLSTMDDCIAMVVWADRVITF